MEVDRSTMANSLEVRVPFLDNDLVDYVLALPAQTKLKGGRLKYLLKTALKGILPGDILYGPKTGFGVPFGTWLRKPLATFLREVFDSSDSTIHILFDQSLLQRLIKEHIDGYRNHDFLLWKALLFTLWYKDYLL